MPFPWSRKKGSKESEKSKKPEEQSELEKLVFESEFTKNLTQADKEQMYKDLSCLPLKNDNVRQAILTDLLEQAKKYEKNENAHIGRKAATEYWKATGKALPEGEVNINDVLGYLRKAIELGMMGGYPFEMVFKYPDRVRKVTHEYVKGWKPPVEEKKRDVTDLTK